MNDDIISKDAVKVVTMLKLDYGVVIDSQELTEEQKLAYINLQYTYLLLNYQSYYWKCKTDKINNVVNEALFKYPAMATVKEVAVFLNVSESTIRDMEWKALSSCTYGE